MNTKTVISKIKKFQYNQFQYQCIYRQEKTVEKHKGRIGAIDKLKLKRAQFESTPLFLSTPIN